MNPSIITAIAAVVVGLAALTVSVWTTLLARRHYRLSVTPHVRVDFSYAPGQPFTVTLSNRGIGPAVIKGMRAWIDGQPVSSPQTAGLVEALRTAGLGGEFYAFNFWEGDALSPGEEKILIQATIDEDGVKTTEELRVALARVGMTIQYETMYGDRHVFAKSLVGRPF